MHNPARDDQESLTSLALDLGECIGVESCIDLITDLSDLENQILSANKTRRKMKREKVSAAVKEYPPSIPWLANNNSHHMPLVMKRYCSDGGRLIIREEKVKSHEYFQAHRAHGRLTLRLVPVTDDESDDFDDDDDEGKIDNVHDDDDDASDELDREVNGFVDVGAEAMAEEEGETSSLNNSSPSSESNCMEKCGGGGGGLSSCVFGMTLPSFRPVRT